MSTAPEIKDQDLDPEAIPLPALHHPNRTRRKDEALVKSRRNGAYRKPRRPVTFSNAQSATLPPCIGVNYLWEPVERGLPDSDTTVLVTATDTDEPVLLGYHDGECWRSQYGEQINVIAFADLPEPYNPRP